LAQPSKKKNPNPSSIDNERSEFAYDFKDLIQKHCRPYCLDSTNKNPVSRTSMLQKINER
jgi:hypothetical protein